jgi:acyl-CoA thioester hydrolase
MEHFRTRRRVEFADTDASGLAHFARFFVFMESAEHAFLESLGVEAGAKREGTGEGMGWPRVGARCEYVAPARFGDTLDILLRVSHRGRTSLGFSFEIRRDETLIARGELRTVCCAIAADGAIRPVTLSEGLAQRLDELGIAETLH